MLFVTVKGTPIPQPRHRIGFNAKLGRAMAFGAKSTHPIHDWRERITHEVQKLMTPGKIAALRGSGPGHLFERAIVACLFVMPRAGENRKKRPNPPRPGGGKGDVDNLIKPVLDVCNEQGWVWKDDRRVFLATGLKREASGDNPLDVPRAEIRIWDAAEFTLEEWVQMAIDLWPVEWSGGVPTK